MTEDTEKPIIMVPYGKSGLTRQWVKEMTLRTSVDHYFKTRQLRLDKYAAKRAKVAEDALAAKSLTETIKE